MLRINLNRWENTNKKALIAVRIAAAVCNLQEDLDGDR